MEEKKQFDYKIFGDDPLLDILHITYTDLCRGRMTPAKTLDDLIFGNYSTTLTNGQIRSVLDVVIDSRWLEHAGKYKVHLTESGVAMYWHLIKTHKDEKQAEKMNVINNWIKLISIALLVIAVITLVAMITDFKIK